MLLSTLKHNELIYWMWSTQDRQTAKSHLHECLLREFRSLERDESLQAGRGRPVGDIAQAAGRSLIPRNGVATSKPSWRGRANGHTRRRANVDPAAGGTQWAGWTVGPHWWEE